MIAGYILTDIAIFFLVYAVIGWVTEVIYQAVSKGIVVNRGFLNGPICPIYGTGAVVATLIFNEIFKNGEAKLWQIFLICMLGSAVIEFVTSYVLEKLFHAVWWDYSEVPFNIQGRICLPASTGFGIAGIFVVKYISPAVFGLFVDVPPLVIEGIAMILIAVLGADLALTVSGLTELVKKMEEMGAEFDRRMEASYQVIEEKRQLITEKWEEYEKLTSDKVKEYTSTMSKAQQHALRSMKQFRSKGAAQIADRVKGTIGSLPVVGNIRKNSDEK